MAALTEDPHRRARTLWFVWVNILSILIAAGIFYAILFFDGLSHVFEPMLMGVYEYKVVVIAIAMSPLFASLLVGMAYAKRAMRRKKAEAASQIAV
jgi:hypothetical protein